MVHGRRAEWSVLHEQKYLLGMKALFHQGMKKDCHQYATSTIYYLQHVFEDKTVLYDHLLDVFTYHEIIQCEKVFNLYIWSDGMATFSLGQVDLLNLINRFFAYNRKNVTLYSLLENTI